MPPVRVASGGTNLRSAEGAGSKANCGDAERLVCAARPTKRREKAMSAMSDLIEDWIQIRSTLQRQLKTLDSNQGQAPLDIPDEMRETTVNHIQQWVADINSLLK